MQAQQTVTFNNQNQPSTMMVAVQQNIVPVYRHQQSIAVGIVLIIIGTLDIILCLVNAVVSIFTNPAAILGILCIITGSFGITAGKRKTRCTITTFLVMCVLVATECLAQLIMSVVSMESYRGLRYSRPGGAYYADMALGLNATLIVLAILQAIFAIWGSAICCKAVCCCAPTMAYSAVPAAAGVVYGQCGQTMTIPSATVVYTANEQQGVSGVGLVPQQQQWAPTQSPPSYAQYASAPPAPNDGAIYPLLPPKC